MDWIYAVLIVASLVYAGCMVVDYLSTVSSLRPRIQGLEEQVTDLDLASNTEMEILDDVHSRAEGAKSTVADLQRQTAEMRNRLEAEKERKRRLEIAVFRKRLRSREPLVTA